MSERSAFFDALTEELPHDAWGDRLKEELEAHLEDAAYFSALEGNSVSDTNAIHALGSPTLILQEFRHAMTYKSPQAFILHAIAAGLLATPLVYLGMIGVINVILALPIFGILFSYFLFALGPMLRHIDGRVIKGTLILLVSGTPSLVVGIPMLFSLASSSIDQNDRTMLAIGIILGIFLTIFSALIAAWEIEWEQKHALTEKNSTLGALRVNLLRILGIVALVFAVLFIAMIQNAPASMSTLESFRFMISSGIAAPNLLIDVMSWITATWISGVVLTGIGIIALGFIVRFIINRTQHKSTSWPWGWMILAFVTFSIVAFPPKANNIQHIAWSDIPHTNISEAIERAQVGPFYAMFKYVNQSNGQQRYYVAQEESQPLQVKQLPDRIFSLTNLTSVDDTTITAKREPIDGTATEIANIWCHWKNPTTGGMQIQNDDVDHDMTGEKVFLENMGPLYCSDLWVGSKQIFTVTEGIIDIGPTDVTVSADGQWLLFMHDTDSQPDGQFSPQEVYLVDLR